MRCALGGCGQNLRRNAVLHCCKPVFAIALRIPCFAQAQGDLPWSPVQRMRPLGCAILLRPSPGWPSLATRPTHALDPVFFTLRKTNTRSSIGEECSTVLGTLHRVVPRQ